MSSQHVATFVGPWPSSLRPFAPSAAASTSTSLLCTKNLRYDSLSASSRVASATASAAAAVASARVASSRQCRRQLRRAGRAPSTRRCASSASSIVEPQTAAGNVSRSKEQNEPTELPGKDVSELASKSGAVPSNAEPSSEETAAFDESMFGDLTVKVDGQERGTNVVGRDAGLCVDVDMDPKRKPYWEDLLELLQVDLQRLLECVYPATSNVAVGCILCDAPKMSLINFQATGNKKATDILSFQDMGPDGPLLGELWVNVELVESEAKRRGYDDVDEFRVLITHGLLHLAGHDHERGTEDLLLHAAEEQWILTRLGWTGTGLIERVDQAALQGKQIPADDPKTPWERLPGNIREAAYRDINNMRFVELKDERLDGMSPDEIQQTLDDDMAEFQAQLAEMEKKTETMDVAGMAFKFRPFHHLQFSGCGNLYGGSRILANWLSGRRHDGEPIRALELSAGAVGMVGAVLVKKLGADVVWTDRQLGAVGALRSNLALNDVTEPQIETFDYVKDDPLAWANGRKFDLIVMSADAVLFKVDDSEARGKEKNEKDLGLGIMLETIKALLSEEGRAMIGVSEYHELIPAFWSLAKDAGFRVARVGDSEGRPVGDARYPTDKEFGVVRLVLPKRR